MIEDQLAEDARLLVLQELAKQRDARLNEVALARVLDVHGIARTQLWLRQQLSTLVELGAIQVDTIGELRVATLRQTGRAHVDRRQVLEGVSRPADVA